MQGQLKERGLSTIQWIMIILMFGALVTAFIYNAGFLQRKSRDNERKRLAKDLTVALENYREDNKHYPYTGDPIPGGTIVSGNNNFSSMLAAVREGNFLQRDKIVDPKFGAIILEFNGSDAYYDGTKFSLRPWECQGNMVIASTDTTGVVYYAYYSPDGKSYVMCVGLEESKTEVYVSPPRELGSDSP